MKIIKIPIRQVGRNPDNPSLRSSKEKYVPVEQTLEIIESGLCNCLTGVQKDTMVLEIYVFNDKD